MKRFSERNTKDAQFFEPSSLRNKGFTSEGKKVYLEINSTRCLAEIVNSDRREVMLVLAERGSEVVSMVGPSVQTVTSLKERVRQDILERGLLGVPDDEVEKSFDVGDDEFGEVDGESENVLSSMSLKYETQRLLSEPAPGISASPSEDNMRYFNVMILGPSQSPYEGGVFKLELFLPEEYPMAAPKSLFGLASGWMLEQFPLRSLSISYHSLVLEFEVRFLTKIYHPNIDKLGRICLDILKDKWSPALQIRTVLLSIQALLSAPNPDDPLSENIAKHWKTNEAEAVETAKEWTRLYASGA
ncbi:hypothetical protein JRO89_XS15G0088400 [Xanthoceras sorbifolium]|uniref:UBC core domain-containing protein n=1 Tax=Xanthoceras sorbifolium TaxID=99658 RepID=A0ABQ8H1D7_9ROSI|nr:hypothetical protein JRO89_XS15G0088400 [Xanthoceras sorbifolium]